MRKEVDKSDYKMIQHSGWLLFLTDEELQYIEVFLWVKGYKESPKWGSDVYSLYNLVMSEKKYRR